MENRNSSLVQLESPDLVVNLAQDLNAYVNGAMILLPTIISASIIVWGITSTLVDIGIRIGRIVCPSLFRGSWDERLQEELKLISQEMPDAKIDVKKLSQPGGIARAVLTEPKQLKRGLKVIKKAKKII